jgi:N-acetylmuramoyl-L-alanine amidase
MQQLGSMCFLAGLFLCSVCASRADARGSRIIVARHAEFFKNATVALGPEAVGVGGLVAEATPEQQAAKPAPPTEQRAPATEPLTGASNHRVVIDPGHGGDEPGSKGSRGTLEKDVVLDLAQATGEALRREGFEVHLTRTEDRTVSQDQRAAAANYWGADALVSLHASGEGRPQARGFEVMVAPDPGPDTDGQLWFGGQVGKAAESRRLAQALRSALGEVLPTFDRGLTELPNPMLEAAACPCCLIEVANLSWPSDEDMLLTAGGRAAIASAIARAVNAFFRGSSR